MTAGEMMSPATNETVPPQKHIHWPLWANSSLYDATELEMVAEAMRAHQALVEAATGVPAIWRQEPVWSHEREFDTQREHSFLSYRAMVLL